jgi:hypothetical protein
MHCLQKHLPQGKQLVLPTKQCLTLVIVYVYLTCAGESVLSRIVNWMIETKPIYSVMKMGAMNAMKSTTQKAGIDWDGHVRRMAATPEVSRGGCGIAQHSLVLRSMA